MVADLGVLASRHQLFRQALPRVSPFYPLDAACPGRPGHQLRLCQPGEPQPADSFTSPTLPGEKRRVAWGPGVETAAPQQGLTLLVLNCLGKDK